MVDDPYRLSAWARPSSYRIELSPDLVNERFRGTVDISIDISQPMDSLVLNSVDLQITSSNLDGNRALRVEFHPDTERVSFTPEDRIEVGTVQLHVEFEGELNDKLLGFYRSKFNLKNPATGTVSEQTIAVTQFESTHARRAFPCFDEPKMKATFSSALVIDPNLFAVSNGAEISRRNLPDGRVRIQFATTMVMSTYLVAFVVGPLKATEPRLVAGMERHIPLRVVYPPGSEKLCDFALDVAEAALKYFENYYGIPYPGDKVDLVAVPDFAFGAMENLGCVTFREVLLLIDPSESTQPELQRVADVINHELAHMWFGNLVTMDWWNGIWLNEAFATFMELTASDAFRPDWDVWTNFGLARTVAFDTDSLHSTRPIEFKVDSPADAEAMFDILTYEKGASVVRMLEQYLGAETFRLGISSYMKKHAYGTTETTDLWESLEEVSGEPVRKMMDSWIFQGGHPSVRVEATDIGVRLTQSRFEYLSNGSDSQLDASSPSWLIPVTLRARALGSTEGLEVHYVLDDPAELDLGFRPEVVQVNVGANGFYRSELTPELRQALCADPTSDALERFMLIDDACAALHAGTVGYDEVWDLLTKMAPREMDPAVWRRIGSAARELNRLGGDANRAAVRRRVVDMSSNPLHDVTRLLTGRKSNDSDHDIERLEEVRGVLIVLRGALGADARTRGRAREIFNDDTQDISLMSAAIEVVAGSATPEEHQELERRWREASTPQEVLRYLTALVDTDLPELFDHALDLTLNEVRTQNAPYLLRRALSHDTLGSVAWEFIRDNWDAITEKFPSNSLPRMIEGIRSVTDRQLASSIQRFLDSTDLISGEQQIDQHIERMWVTVLVAERVRNSVT